MLGASATHFARWRMVSLILPAIGLAILLLLSSSTQYSPKNLLQIDAFSFKPEKTFTDSAVGLTSHPLPGSPEAYAFWVDYADVLVKGNMSFPAVREKANLTDWPMIDFRSVTFADSRVDRTEMTDEEVEDMKVNHAYVKSRFSEIAPRLPFVPNTRGIIMTTSIEAMGYFSVSLRMLRKTGTTLPVEIWMYDRSVFGMDPYGLRICSEIWLKVLGATCKFVEDYLPNPRPHPLDIETYKYENKLGAMLFSTFEQFLFIDSDNMPVMPLDDFFTQEPFLSKGYITWPDYWADTSSHYYYEIAGTTADGLMTRATSESGQVMMNKRTHAEALLMASYYVRYGSQYYFQLFTQGAMGMGDKECYLKAAQVFNLPYYQVTERPDRLGYRCNNEKPLASGQHHPGDDYFLTSRGIRRDWRMDTLSDGSSPRIAFIHANIPRMDPPRYLDWGDPVWPDQHRCTNTSKAHRIYGTRRLTLLKHGWDVEKAVWDTMRWVACDLEDYMVQWWNGTFWNNFTPRLNTCKDMIALYDELMTENEGLQYDDTLNSPYTKGGEVDAQLQTNFVNKLSWESIRAVSRWTVVR